MNFVNFWRNCERMGFVSSVFDIRCERMAFVSFWRTCESMAFVSFWRTCERMDFVNFWRNCERMDFVSSVFGVMCCEREHADFVSSCDRMGVPVNYGFRQFLAYVNV